MIEIIQERERIVNTTYVLSYLWKDDKGAGFSFPCSKEGVYIPGHAASQENYEKCINGEYDVEFEGVVEYNNSYIQTKIGRCSCGEEVGLSHFTNVCDCGKLYNSSGQSLVDPSLWGEETGENFGSHEIDW